MKNIPIANKKEFKSIDPSKGQFIIEPFYPGYGLTVGNALRRVLLSSLEGVAITSIRLKGAEHEFSNIEGVKEDVVDIILNLKQVRFEVTTNIDEPIKLELKANGEKEIKAGDFKKVSGVKITNPELKLAILTDSKAEFDLEVWIENGRGYLPVEIMNKEEKEIGVIAIDAFFSPVKKVSIDTENVRVGDMTNWDRLILNIETDATISCEEAVRKAGEILVEQFSFFTQNKVEKIEEPKEKKEEEKNEDVNVESKKNVEKLKKRGRPKKDI